MNRGGHVTWAEIDIGALRHNFSLLNKAVGSAAIMPVVKADGYGHGAVESAKAFLEEGAPFFAVAFVNEGIELRDAGLNTPILVFARPDPELVGIQIERELDLTVSHPDDVALIAERARRLSVSARVHLNVDTGMSRLGVSPADALETARDIAAEPNLSLTGLYSHLAASDEENPSFVVEQLGAFIQVADALAVEKITPCFKHLANSGAILHHPSTHLDMVRAGVSLYGYHPAPDRQNETELLQVMTLKSTVSQVRSLSAGASVSYGRTWKAERPTKVAVIPAGYADGISRALSGKMEVLIGGRRFPVVGRVCMDMIIADIGDAPVHRGDEVVIYGKQGSEAIHVADVAFKLGTISYEITCAVSKRVPRVYVNR